MAVRLVEARGVCVQGESYSNSLVLGFPVCLTTFCPSHISRTVAEVEDRISFSSSSGESRALKKLINTS